MFGQENENQFQNVWGPTPETTGQQCVRCKMIVHTFKELSEHECSGPDPSMSEDSNNEFDF